MNRATKTFIAGHRGLVGSALLRLYQHDPTRQVVTRSRAHLNLTDFVAVDRFFATERPDEVLLVAATVGGILANQNAPVDFLLSNLQIQNNVMAASQRYDVRKLLFLGSSCCYPKLAPQPICEESLLTGQLEPTSEPYAVAKIAGIKLAQSFRRQFGCNFITAIPATLYGPHDHFDTQTSHVLPALIRKFHDAKLAGHDSVTLWGSGNPRREFLYVDDLAHACIHLMENYHSDQIVNVGTGMDVTISELAQRIARVVGFHGAILWDVSKPDGAPRKLLDNVRIRNLGWQARISLEEGIARTYAWFCEND